MPRTCTAARGTAGKDGRSIRPWRVTSTAITVLLLCLQLKEFTLGASLVLCFSLGLAVTLVAVGVAAALSVRHVSRRWSGFAAFARRAPYASGALIILVGLYVGAHGLHALTLHG
jgi:nickel/cobalt transporter (NicO) family protein